MADWASMGIVPAKEEKKSHQEGLRHDERRRSSGTKIVIGKDRGRLSIWGATVG